MEQRMIRRLLNNAKGECFCSSARCASISANRDAYENLENDAVRDHAHRKDLHADLLHPRTVRLAALLVALGVSVVHALVLVFFSVSVIMAVIRTFCRPSRIEGLRLGDELGALAFLPQLDHVTHRSRAIGVEFSRVAC